MSILHVVLKNLLTGEYELKQSIFKMELSVGRNQRDFDELHAPTNYDVWC